MSCSYGAKVERRVRSRLSLVVSRWIGVSVSGGEEWP